MPPLPFSIFPIVLLASNVLQCSFSVCLVLLFVCLFVGFFATLSLADGIYIQAIFVSILVLQIVPVPDGSKSRDVFNTIPQWNAMWTTMLKMQYDRQTNDILNSPPRDELLSLIVEVAHMVILQ